ncbi:hypothetical protein LPB86_16615 [Pedobacter sp. MC2016-14]|uniref:DUF6965 family protein n=1 Tax=Pedobacter sp. MC2016-14 TaxID=2897327 RepID=UPI001E290AB8|nr:hypothetical protein [Pedobacter sp. MC2016-14]MCD0489867.1 hypothetical protein [Pedobacter sp. MC2016-14]
MTIEELEDYFTGIDLPETMDLYPGVKISDVRGCIASHLDVLKLKGELKIYAGFKHRLLLIKEILETQELKKVQ